MCHVSHVRCHISHIIFSKGWKLVNGGSWSVMNGAYRAKFHKGLPNQLMWVKKVFVEQPRLHRACWILPCFFVFFCTVFLCDFLVVVSIIVFVVIIVAGTQTDTKTDRQKFRLKNSTGQELNLIKNSVSSVSWCCSYNSPSYTFFCLLIFLFISRKQLITFHYLVLFYSNVLFYMLYYCLVPTPARWIVELLPRRDQN